MVRGAWHRLVGPHQLRTGGQTKSERTGTSRGDRDPGPHYWWDAGFIYHCQRDFGSRAMDKSDAAGPANRPSGGRGPERVAARHDSAQTPALIALRPTV